MTNAWAQTVTTAWAQTVTTAWAQTVTNVWAQTVTRYRVGSDCDELWYVWCQISYPTYEPYLPSSKMEISHTAKIFYLHTMLLWSQKLMCEIKIANQQWKI